ncbi:MAG TPA: carboxypeptidase-like regulatory domain-containing protein [Chitinophagaceae bacterium]|nr:carboxypeptidase-like regulatory domain-containing protein [Chitinophagaceae bacterium]
MKNNLSIHIANPCHENWENMTPGAKGRFCQSCAKTVVDFAAMTDSEILHYFSKTTGNTCGRFAKDQLQRPLQPLKEEKRKAWWIAAMMPLLMFFKKADAQKKNIKDTAENVIKLEEAMMGLGDVVVMRNGGGGATDYWHVEDDDSPVLPTAAEIQQPKYNVALTLKRPVGDPHFVVSGKVIEAGNKEPLSFATVSIKGSKTAVVTDAGGHFTIKGETYGKSEVLTINCVGFSDAEVLVNIKDTGIINKVFHCTIEGTVINAKNGQPVAFATIQNKNSHNIIASDVNGNFRLAINAKKPIHTLNITSVGFANLEVPLPVPDPTGKINLGTIKLAEMAPSLDEIVLTGYTIVCKKPVKQEITASVIKKFFVTEKFTVSPNPVQRGNNIHIAMKNEGTYSIQLFDNMCNLISISPMNVMDKSRQATINIPADVAAGTYYIRLIDEKTKKQYTDKIVVM